MNDSAARPRAGRSALKRTLAARRARDEQLALLRSDPIAIVGMGCRFPGGIDGPDAFWRLLAAGSDAISEVPQQRWDVASRYDPDPAAPGKIVAKHGGFLADSMLSTRATSASCRAKPSGWIRSSGCSSRWPSRRSTMPGRRRDGWPDRRTGVFVASYHNDYATLA